MKSLALIGAGSHSDAVYSSINFNEYNVIGYFDDKDISSYNGYPILGKINQIDELIEEYNIDAIFIAIGDNYKRYEIFNQIKDNHYNKLINIISDSAKVLDLSSLKGKGIYISHMTFIGAKVIIHDNVIVNTGSIIEHHSTINSTCNITPRSVINGLITLGEGCYVGSSSVIIQCINVAPWIFIGAGAVVTKDLTCEHSLYYGTPARYVRKYKQT